MPDVVRRWDLVERLQRGSEFWGPLILLLDDAHLIDSETFAELRTLLEEEVNGQKLVRLLISGPLTLEETLAQPAMNDFAQKIRCHVFLQPFRITESVEYLKQQIRNAGGNPSDVFENSAIELIVAAADGIPRCLNLLADESLMVCEETDCHSVSAQQVNAALMRLQHLPVAWNAIPDTREPDADEYDAGVDDFHAAADSSGSSSVVEIGSPAGHSSSVVEIGGAPEPSSSVVEIGGAPEPSSGVVEIAGAAEPSSSAIEVGGPPEQNVGAIEIGGDSEASETTPIHDLPEDAEATEDSVETAVTEDAECLDVDSYEIEIGSPEVPATFTEGEPSSEHESIAAEAGEFDVALDSESPVVSERETESSADCDLVHHLVLADSRETVDEAEDLSAYSEVNSIDDAATIEFAAYLPWIPAGTWPAPDIHDLIAEQTPDVADPSTTLLQVNRSPVFDRYTWNELGRPVTSEQRISPTYTRSVADHAVWPPETNGIAPDSSIPVVAWGEDSGIRPVFDFEGDRRDGHGSDAEPETFIFVPPNRERENPYDTLPEFSEADPDLTIDQIQEMLHSEIFEEPEDPPTPAAADTEQEIVVDPYSDERQIWVHGRMLDEFGEAKRRLAADADSAIDPSDDDLPLPASHSFIGVTSEESYEPRLLQEAGIRAAGIASARKVETESDATRFVEPEQQPDPVDAVVSEFRPSVVPETQETTADPDSARPKSRFADLFTRLRNLQNRSA